MTETEIAKMKRVCCRTYNSLNLTNIKGIERGGETNEWNESVTDSSILASVKRVSQSVTEISENLGFGEVKSSPIIHPLYSLPFLEGNDEEKGNGEKIPFNFGSVVGCPFGSSLSCSVSQPILNYA